MVRTSSDSSPVHLTLVPLSRWTSGYHGQPIAFVDQQVLFYAVDDGLRFHDFTQNDNQKCSTISTNGVGVGVIVRTLSPSCESS